MRILTDTNILLRGAQATHAIHPQVVLAVTALLRQDETLCVTSQVLAEFWVVATRPIANNGLGLSAVEASRELDSIEKVFDLLPDNASVYPEWKRLVLRYSVVGARAHDARLVAAMKVHGVTAILTLDEADFARYSEIRIIHPKDVVTP